MMRERESATSTQRSYREVEVQEVKIQFLVYSYLLMEQLWSEVDEIIPLRCFGLIAFN